MKNTLTTITIDSREPEWARKLEFCELQDVRELETGDYKATTSDGYTLTMERKTPEDYLGSLKDGRLFEQARRLSEPRYFAQLRGEKPKDIPYLIVTGVFTPSADGRVFTTRQTGWNYAAVMASILSIQEAGVFVVFCAEDDFRDCVIRLAERSREETLEILPPRPIDLLGPKEAALASLPGIGIERAKAALEWGGWNLAWTLAGLTDETIESPVPKSVRKNLRVLFGLEDGQELTVFGEEKSPQAKTL